MIPPTSDSPLLSLIIPCRNGLGFLKDCLASLELQAFKKFEVVIIDNGSEDGLGEWLKGARFPYPLRVLSEKINLGYAAAVNKGISRSSAKTLVVLNSDLTFEPFFLEEIYRAFLDPEILITALHVKDRNGNSTESKGLYLTRFLRAKNLKSQGRILGPAGSAFAFSRSLLQKVSIQEGLLYDERYFFLWEDMELALRLTRLGIKTDILEKAVCYHHGNSTKSGYWYKQYLSLRNRFFLIRDYYPAYPRRYWPVVLLYDLPRFLFFFLLNPYRNRFLKDLKTHFRKAG